MTCICRCCSIPVSTTVYDHSNNQRSYEDVVKFNAYDVWKVANSYNLFLIQNLKISIKTIKQTNKNKLVIPIPACIVRRPLAHADVHNLGWFSDRTGTSVDDGKAREKDWTKLAVTNLTLCYWSSQHRGKTHCAWAQNLHPPAFYFQSSI